MPNPFSVRVIEKETLTTCEIQIGDRGKVHIKEIQMDDGRVVIQCVEGEPAKGPLDWQPRWVKHWIFGVGNWGD